jgi:hypothetical protein
VVSSGANAYRNAFDVVEKSSALDAIGNGEVAAFENLAIEQLKIDLPLHFIKERNARAEQNEMNVEDDFIDQIGFEQALGHRFEESRFFAPSGARCL